MIEKKLSEYTTGNNTGPGRPLRIAAFSDRSVAIRIFFTCWLVFSLHFATNTVREIFPGLSLAEKLSFDVSEYAGLHPDIFTIEGRGTFINNNPGASMIGAVPYALSRPLTDRIVDRVQRARAAEPKNEEATYDTIYPMAEEFLKKSRERGFDVKFGLGAAIMQAFATAPVSAIGAVVMFWLLLSMTGNRQAAILLALLYAFATPILFRTAQLNQNVMLASFALFSFALLWRPQLPGADEKKPSWFFAGLFAGWTVVLDYSGLVAVACLGGYAMIRWSSIAAGDRKLADLARFGAGIAICALVLMAYQWSSFGNPIFPAQSYMPPANFTDLGYRGFSFPSVDLLAQTAFSYRYGLFTSSPLLLLAFLFPFWFRKRHALLERRELVFVVSFITLFFVFCAANQYGRMQFNTGVRHILPAVPFIFLLAANVLVRMNRLAAALIALPALYWSWCLAMYRDVEQGFGIFEAIRHITLEGFRLPWLTTLEKMGYVNDASPIPLFVFSAAVIWVFWTQGAISGKTAQER